MNNRRIIIVMAIAVCLLTTLACTVSPTVPKTAGKMEFVAEKTTIEQGDCVNIFWDIEGGANVKLNNEAVQLTATRFVCPDAATTYVLSADFANNTELRKITIQVNKKAAAPPVQSQAKPSLDFWADRTTINKGECTTLHWRASGGGVWIGEKGYSPVSEVEVCPSETQKYTAEVGDQLVVKSVVITVQAGGAQAPAAQPQAQPQQQPPANNPNTQTTKPKVVFAVTDVKLLLDTGADPQVIAAITTNAAGEVVWRWEYYGARNCFGSINFAAAGTKIVNCSYTTANGATFPTNYEGQTLEFYVYAPDRKLVGSINIPKKQPEIDLAVTDIFPDNLPRGNVFIRITNRGPDSGKGQDIHLNCTALLSPLPGVIAPADPISVNFLINNNSQSKGETKEFGTGIGVDSDSYSYMITCRIDAGSGDPNPSNNQYSEAIP